VNLIGTRKREHSRKPDEVYQLIENCSWGPYLELFARTMRENWTVWGNQAPEETGSFTGPTHGPAYSHTPIESLKKPSQLILCETPAVEQKIRTRKTA